MLVKVEFVYLRDEYSEDITIRTKNIELEDPNGTYNILDKSLTFKVEQTQNEFLGLNKNTVGVINKSSFYISEFGQFLVITFPPIATLIAPLNILKLIALIPIKLHIRYIKVLQIFVKFEEEDMLSKLIDKGRLYSSHYKDLKLFVPENDEFKFVSIYPRIRGFKMFLRIIANLVFVFYANELNKNVHRY